MEGGIPASRLVQLHGNGNVNGNVNSLDADHADKNPETARIQQRNGKVLLLTATATAVPWFFRCSSQSPSQLPYPCRFRFHPRHPRSTLLTLPLLLLLQLPLLSK
jgi:hypothetical protein